MPDMLVRLFDLPDDTVAREALRAAGVICRRAENYERSAVLQFVKERWPGWPDEVTAAFAHVPPTLYIATRNDLIVGFAAYNATRPDFFGPTGVDESERGNGVGGALLKQCLAALAAEGYAYAIIGGVGPAIFYEKTVNAVIIPDTEPGLFGNHIRVQST
ncbi:MAG: GNAT family N-acetyltransferase [Tepidiformaceae bacterium]